MAQAQHLLQLCGNRAESAAGLPSQAGTLGRLRQEDCKLKGSLGYMETPPPPPREGVIHVWHAELLW